MLQRRRAGECAVFLVVATYLLHEFTPEREEQLTKAAGTAHIRGETTGTIRVRVWSSDTFWGAVEMRRRLITLAGVRAFVREP